jgi:hypothetical protein
MCWDDMTVYKTYCQKFQVVLTADCPIFWVPGTPHLDWYVVHFGGTDEPLEAISLPRSHCHQQEIYKQNMSMTIQETWHQLTKQNTFLNISH